MSRMDNSFEVLTLDWGIVAAGAFLGFLASVCIFWIARCLIKGRKRRFGFGDFAKGSDGHYSLSNFQFVIWTFMLTFAFLTVWILRVGSGLYNPTEIPDLPRYLLILTGISVVNPFLSTGITRMKIENKESLPRPPLYPTETNSGSEHETNSDPEHECYWGEMLMQNKRPALNRLQNFAWTCISILIYALVFLGEITKPETTLIVPDIDPILVALMGMSTFAFLGGKMVEGTQIAIIDISPRSGKATNPVTLYGINFGDQPGFVEFGDKIVNVESEDWKTGKIKFKVPKEPAGKYVVRVRVDNGKLSGNSKEYEVQ